MHLHVPSKTSCAVWCTSCTSPCRTLLLPLLMSWSALGLSWNIPGLREWRPNHVTCHKLVTEFHGICCVGFLWNFVQQLVDFRKPSAVSSQIIQRNTAGYLRNLRIYLRNVPLKGCRGLQKKLSFQGTILRTPKDYSEDSRRRFNGLDNLWSPKGCSKDCHKTIPRIPKNHSVGSPQTICEFQHRFLRKATTDFHGSCQIFVINMWHVPYI